MGLDVNLCRYDNLEDAKDMDFEDYETVEENSSINADHLFKIGYLRSSYNDGGIDRVLKNMGLPTLWDIFGADGEEYAFQPDWETALAIAKNVLTLYRSKTKLAAFDVAHNHFTVEREGIYGPRSARGAVEILETYLKKKDEGAFAFSDGNFSALEGDFFLSGFEILAAVVGVNTFDQPCVYIVHRMMDDDWYDEALQITIEMIEWVIAQEDRDHYVLHWSY